MSNLLSLCGGSLTVTSRMIMRPFLEELRSLAVPVLEGLDRRSAFEGSLRELTVVEADVAQEPTLSGMLPLGFRS